MEMSISPQQFHKALLSGAVGIINKREELNRINGFPVPDKDTGNNLGFMMQHIRKQLLPASNFKNLLNKLSELSLIASRGSSGAIFSQYFAGFKRAYTNLEAEIKEALSLKELFLMFSEGYINAYQSLQNPREGTILSAMYSFKEGFHHADGKGIKFELASQTAIDKLQQAVEDSSKILPQQKAMKAPDAGAMAFYYFADGFLSSLMDKAPVENQTFMDLPEIEENEMIHAGSEPYKYRFCTEVLLDLTDDKPISEKVKADLTALGDTLVVSQAGQLARIHLHTNNASKMVDLVENLGVLREVKSDDMNMQQALAQTHPGKIALVTDSIADVPEELLGPHVYTLPIHLMANGVSYQDKRTISFSRVKKLAGKLTSSQLNLSEIQNFLDPILKAYEQVLIITVSSKMSGIYARCEEYLVGKNTTAVRLVDSKQNSGAQGLLVLHAARRLQQGASLHEIADEIESLRARTKIFVGLPNLKAMIASGRLNTRIGNMLQAIGFLPLVTINRAGEGTITGISLSRDRSDKLLMQKIQKSNVESYAVVHVNDEKRALRAAHKIEQKIGMKPEYICDISSIVANFSGENSYAVAFIEKEKPK